jgi:endonuclease/exonuclease/phosphatase family metal-dependent hydrolase
MAKLVLAEFNVENLFLSMEYYQGEDLSDLKEPAWKDFALPQVRRQQKPLRKLWGLARTISEMNPDILLLVEVGGRESLANFNQHFLQNRFDPYFVDGNSSRAIDLGFLVKKGLPFEISVHSNRHLPVEVKSYLGNHTAKFSRDVAELRLKKKGALELIVFLTHLKSKISSDHDFRGNDMRAAEAAALAALYRTRRAEFSGTPIVLGGDFNSSLESSELAPLLETDLLDFQSLLGRTPEERSTYVHFDYRDTAHPQVLDYLLVSPELKEKISQRSGVHRYRGFYDLPEPLPESLRERFRQPSDHFPLLLELML